MLRSETKEEAQDILISMAEEGKLDHPPAKLFLAGHGKQINYEK